MKYRKTAIRPFVAIALVPLLLLAACTPMAELAAPADVAHCKAMGEVASPGQAGAAESDNVDALRKEAAQRGATHVIPEAGPTASAPATKGMMYQCDERQGVKSTRSYQRMGF